MSVTHLRVVGGVGGTCTAENEVMECDTRKRVAEVWYPSYHTRNRNQTQPVRKHTLRSVYYGQWSPGVLIGWGELYQLIIS